MLKNRDTYEIMDPKEIGWADTELPLTKHSGRAAVVSRLQKLGFTLSEAEVGSIFKRFKDIGDRKKFVYDDDLAALVDDSMDAMAPDANSFVLDHIQISSGTSPIIPTATVALRRGEELLTDSCPGNGAVDAVMKCIDRILKKQGHLMEFTVQATTGGKDAVAEATIKADFGDGSLVTGQGASTDTIEAAARAYLNAVNRFTNQGSRSKTAEFHGV